MATRGLELNTRITALDDASEVVEKVGRKMADFESEKHVAELDADSSKADQEVKQLDRRLDDLTNEDRVAVLEVQAKQAKREVDTLTRKLANADKYDDDEIRLYVTARDDASKKLANIRAEINKLDDAADDAGSSIGEKLSGAFEGLGGKFSGLGGKLGGMMAGGFAAAGVGALMVKALESSWERAGGIRRIAGQFRLSAEEAGKYGKIAGELYSENWGDSVVEVQQVVALAGQRLEDATGSTLENISAQIIATADTWGEDYEAIIRSITQLTQNDLADSSQEALDLIVTGFQDGANEAGDFLDTIDEYAQHFESMGLSGEDALNMIISGLQNGQRDTDKIGDAVKEMRLRVVEDSDAVRDALNNIGLEADDVVDAFLEGGPAARNAFLDVIEGLKRGQAEGDSTANAVALIGTQFEDMGPKALEILGTVEGALRDTEGAAGDLATTVGEVSPWEDAKREGEELLGSVGDALGRQFGPMLRDTNDFLDGLGNGFGLLGDSAEDVVVDIDGMYASTRNAGRAARVLGEEVDISSEFLRDQAKAANHAADEASALADRQQEAAEATERHRAAVAALFDEVNNNLSTMFDYDDAVIELQNGSEDLAKETWDLVEAYNKGEITTAEYERGLRDLRTEENQLARSALDTATAYAESQGAIEGTTGFAMLQREELERLRDRFPELTDEIDLFIAELDKIPAVKTVSLILERDSVNAQLSKSTGGSVRVDEFGNLRSVGVGATGGIVTRPTLSVIGEAGPEAVVPLNRMPGASPLPATGGGITWTGDLIVQAPFGADADEFGRQAWNAIVRQSRWNGPFPNSVAA